MNDLTFGLIYSRIMESRHLSLNNTIINYRQLITSTVEVDTHIYIYRLHYIYCSVYYIFFPLK